MRESHFSVLDWIVVAINGFLVVGLMAFPLVGSSLRSMFADFATPLPLVTQVVIGGWPPVAAAALSLVGLWLAFRAVPLSRRRWWIVVTFAFSVATMGAYLGSMYLPIFVAQRALRPRTTNPKAVGSNPTGPTSCALYLSICEAPILRKWGQS